MSTTRRQGRALPVQKYAQLGRLVAYVIAGHHAGLANGTGDGDPTPLATRLDARKYSGVAGCTGWEADIVLPALPVQEFRFQDQCMCLAEEARQELYKDDLGFDWSDPTFRNVEGAWLSKDGENIVVLVEGAERGSLPIHTIGSIVGFGRVLISPPLLGACAGAGIAVAHFSERAARPFSSPTRRGSATRSSIRSWRKRSRVGLLWHAQAQLMARHLRGDLDAYPPFVWRWALSNRSLKPTRSISPASWRPFSVCRGRRHRKFFSRALDNCDRLIVTRSRALISAISRGIVQLGRSATGASSSGVTTRKAASVFTGGGPAYTLALVCRTRVHRSGVSRWPPPAFEP